MNMIAKSPTDDKSKSPTLMRDPIIKRLVIQDLVEMERTGNFDTNVLLWVQDRYTNQAIAENRTELRDMHHKMMAENAPQEVMRAARARAIVEFTRETYSAAKSEGSGADLKTYLEAAEVFYQTESARYGAHLQEVSEYIRKALENGEKPDIEKIGVHAYISMAKLSGAMENLTKLSGKPMASRVAETMRQGIENIHFGAVGDAPNKAVGKEILRFVDTVSKQPDRYVEFRDPTSMIAPSDPWGLEPMHRSDKVQWDGGVGDLISRSRARRNDGPGEPDPGIDSEWILVPK